MGQRHWIRGFARLFLLVAVADPGAAVAAHRRPGHGGLQPDRRRRQPADRGGLDPGLRRHRAGQPVTPEQLNLAVRNLFETGLFEDVQVMPEAGRLVITVRENPTINQIAFEGNDSLDDEELTEVIQLRPRLAYSVPAAEQDAQRIIDAYRAAGRYAAAVRPVIIRLPENRVNLVYEIRKAAHLGAADQLPRQRGVLRPQAQAGDRDQPVELAELRFGWQHLRRRQARARPRAAAPVLPRARLHRLPGPVLDRGDRPRAHRLLPVLHRLRRPAVQLRPGLGQLAGPGPQRGRLRAAAGAGGGPGRLQRQAGRPGGPAHDLPGRAGRIRLRRDPPAGDQERGGAHGRHQLRAGRGRAGLRRAHRHHRQHPHARPGDPPPVPPRRGRRLQLARDQRGRGPDQRPRLLQGGHGQRPPGHRPRTRRWSTWWSRSSPPAA